MYIVLKLDSWWCISIFLIGSNWRITTTCRYQAALILLHIVSKIANLPITGTEGHHQNLQQEILSGSSVSAWSYPYIVASKSIKHNILCLRMCSPWQRQESLFPGLGIRRQQ